MRAAEQKLGKRNKVIKLAPVQLRTKQIADNRAVNRSSVQVAVLKPIPAQLRREAQPARGVISERAAGAVVVKICERTSRTKMHVVVQYGKFVARHELAHCVTVFASGRPRCGKWLWHRGRGEREDSFGRCKRILRGATRSCGGFLGGIFRTARGIASGFLLRAQRRRKKDAQGCCYAPIAHLFLLRTS